jgi:hypothetical protein
MVPWVYGCRRKLDLEGMKFFVDDMIIVYVYPFAQSYMIDDLTFGRAC